MNTFFKTWKERLKQKMKKRPQVPLLVNEMGNITKCLRQCLIIIIVYLWNQLLVGPVVRVLFSSEAHFCYMTDDFCFSSYILWRYLCSQHVNLFTFFLVRHSSHLLLIRLKQLALLSDDMQHRTNQNDTDPRNLHQTYILQWLWLWLWCEV